ncbi:SnoaL-domain-containing protein [Hypomontagnella monticulosa]|nr:SnoaL-domain-containing protein [Hypomontagnella monticulosa]
MTDIEATYRSLINCINEKRWGDMPRYMHSHFEKDGQDYTPESYAAQMESNGETELIVDAVTVDQESQECLGATVLVKFKTNVINEGHAKQQAGKTVLLMAQHFNWFTEGKISKTLTVADRDEMHRQFTDPEASFTPDLISHYQPPPRASSDAALSARELEDKYRQYIGCINAQTMEAELHRFCHPQVVHNTKALTIEEYRLLIQEAFTAIPDITFGLHTVVVDERAQRVAVRIEFSGTPIGVFAGVKPNGRSVSFCEHVTYRFEEGKIARVWSIVDWPSYQAQLSESLTVVREKLEKVEK